MNDATVSLRAATPADARLLFDWVNTPDSLAQKERTEGPVTWAEHVAWLERLLADRGSRLFIVEHADRPVGQVRLEQAGNAHRVDIYVAPSARRRGVALAALTQAIQRAAAGVAVARVKIGNAASRRLFEAAGFVERGRDGDIMIYRLEPAKVRHG